MKTNIVLIGIMGCGKTTLGKILAEQLNMSYIDIDQFIEEQYGSIKSLFKVSEEYFRLNECKAVNIISKLNHTVISTGGGVVLKASNMKALKENGIVFYIKRPIDDIISTIDIKDRPLLKDGDKVLYRLINEREPLYSFYSDYCIDNSNIDKAVSVIISIFNNR